MFGSEDEAFPAFRILNPGLLESAVALPHQPYYETFADKLAAMVRSIACNHALVDGNKRLAVTVLHATLIWNNRNWYWSDEDAANAMLRAAQGDNDYRWLTAFITAYSLPVPDLTAAIETDGAGLDTAISAMRRATDDALKNSAATSPAAAEFISAFRHEISAVARGDADARPISIDEFAIKWRERQTR